MFKILLIIRVIISVIPILVVITFSRKRGFKMLANFLHRMFPDGLSDDELSELKEMTKNILLLEGIDFKNLKLKQRMKVFANNETARMFQSDMNYLAQEMKEEGLSDSKILNQIRVQWIKVVISYHLHNIKDFVTGIIKVTIGD